MKFDRRTAILGLAGLTAGCGGGSSSPAPSPTPTPAPTPTPTPPPATTTPFRVTGVGPFIALVNFKRDPPSIAAAPGSGVASGWTDADGLFRGPPPVNPFVPGALISGADTTGDLSRWHKVAIGYDVLGQTYAFLYAPAGSLAVTPITSLMAYGPSQDRVKQAFSMRSSLYGVKGDPDVSRFDVTGALRSADPALRRQGEQLQAAHLRVLAMTQAFYQIRSPSTQFSSDEINNTFWFELARALANLGDRELISQEGATALVDAAIAASFTPTTYLPQVRDAAASLIANFLIAIGSFVTSDAMAGGWNIAIRTILRAELQRLLLANTPAAAAQALAILAPPIRNRMLPYTSALPWVPGTLQFAANKGAAMRNGETLTLLNRSPTGNVPFFAFSLKADRNAGFSNANRLASVRVPSPQDGEISATLLADGQTVEVTARGAFVGVSWFDYVVRHDDGTEGTGRIFIEVLP